MNWTLVLIGFALAVFMGGGIAALLVQMRPHWSALRRGLVAASVLPAVTLMATLSGFAWVLSLDHPGGGGMRDLAAKAVAVLGLGFTLLAFFGGLIGATLAQHRKLR
jgi:hypothetical protein